MSKQRLNFARRHASQPTIKLLVIVVVVFFGGKFSLIFFSLLFPLSIFRENVLNSLRSTFLFAVRQGRKPNVSMKVKFLYVSK